jgi:hypothetical protein
VLVTVIYPRGSLKSGVDDSIELSPFRQHDDEMLYDVDVPDNAPDEVVLDTVWRYANRVDNGPIEQQLAQFGERSMMVGDVAKFRDRTYVCKVMGWKEINSLEELRCDDPTKQLLANHFPGINV